MKPSKIIITVALVFFIFNSMASADLSNPTYANAKEAYEQGKWDLALKLFRKYKIEDSTYLSKNPKVMSKINDAISDCMNKILLITSFQGHGSLSIVLRNNICTVIASDSRLVLDNVNNVRYQDNIKKLYKVTDDIVVSVAGYYYIGLNHNGELTNNISAIIENYIAELILKKYKPTYHEVVVVLTSAISSYLTSLSISQSQETKLNNIRPETQLIFTGIDNGKFAATKLNLRYKQTKDGECAYSIDKGEDVLRINDILYQQAGWADIANDIMLNPDKYRIANEKGINQYLRASHEHNTAMMSCEDLVDLSESIMKQTSAKNDRIGGPVHTAIWRNNIFQVNFPAGAHYNIIHSPFIFVYNTNNTNFSVTGSKNENVITINTNNLYTDRRVYLDNTHYFYNAFYNCIIEISSDKFHFDESNKIDNCILVLNANINVESPKIKQLINKFRWTNVVIKAYLADSGKSGVSERGGVCP